MSNLGLQMQYTLIRLKYIFIINVFSYVSLYQSATSVQTGSPIVACWSSPLAGLCDASNKLHGRIIKA